MILRNKQRKAKTKVEETFPEPHIISDRVDGGEWPGSEIISVGRATASLAELDSAAEENTVGLDHIIMARYLGQALNAQVSANERAEYAGRVGRLVSIYFKSVPIVDRHFCRYIPAAVVLRRYKGYEPLSIEMVYLPEASKTTDPDLEAAIWKARAYFLEARQCRNRPRSDSLVRDTFALIVNLLSLADAEAMEGYDRGRTAQAQPKINEELRRVGAAISRATLVEARQVYLLGMLVGAVVLGGGVVLVNFLISLSTNVVIDTVGLGVVLAGGVGAILSVMTRVTANNLMVDPGVGRRLALVAGGFRPLIGGLFAFALYIFVVGGLLPLKVTATGIQATYFYLGVAFLAGFSERFAQDAVTRAGSVIADTTPSERSGTSVGQVQQS
jgi:hypothetical protein